MSNPNPLSQNKYRVIVDEWRERIVGGAWPPGHRLPGFAELQAAQGLGTNTVNRVFQELEREGLIERRRGSGVFVTVRPAPAKTATIAVSFGPLTTEGAYYWFSIMCGVQRATLRHGLDNLLPISTTTLPLEKCDGMLFHPGRGAPPPLIPTVAIMASFPDMPSVLPDEEDGAKQAVRHLLRLGHRRIAYMLWPDRGPGMALRLRGYRTAMAEDGVEPRDGWVLDMRYYLESPPSQYHHGYFNMLHWLREGFLETGCTALLVHNDSHAMGAMKALQDAGLDVPRDISVIGFDGTGEADRAVPSLTTLVMPLEEIAEVAVDLLVRRIGGDAVPNAAVVFPVRLQIGESIAPPKR